ncbi:MAG: hypothetical protein LC104_14780 [Bacteroidales bacterium]|nr:hypothetical protein [Bacteroidales bacterium]
MDLTLLAQAADPVTEIATDSGKKVVVAVVVGLVTTVGSFLFGRYWGRYKAHREWTKQEFFNRIIVSFNIFSDGYLKIRTVMERSLDEIFLNQIAIEKVLTAAQSCTLDQPIMPIAPKDRWYLLNYVLNAVAEHFVEGHVRQDAGLPVTKVRYALFLTCELVGDERIRKVRAMLLRVEHLENFPYPDSLPKFSSPWHECRILTLRAAAELYKKEPDNFLIIEICV